MFREKTTVSAVGPGGGTNYASVRNACKLCSPLGASIAFKGIRGCLPLLHGSQGCSTYIRRYMISHFKEPVDIASTNFSEESTIFGGKANFHTGVDNIIHQYHPEVIGIASTCLSETIGEDIPGLIRGYVSGRDKDSLPVFINVSTPSYRGTHMDGFHEAVLAMVKTLAVSNFSGNHINVFTGFVSPEDIRHIKDILKAFGIRYILLPDYEETLDGTSWREYQLISEGGTPVKDIAYAGSAGASLEMGAVAHQGTTAGSWLKEKHQIPHHGLPLPVGIKLTDRFMQVLEEISGSNCPGYLLKQRGRLIDAYRDGHKYVFGKRVVVYGEEDLVISTVSFLNEIGMKVVLAGSGARDPHFREKITLHTGSDDPEMKVLNGMDFEHINDLACELRPDLIIGNSKGYYIARRLKIPMIRIGFPVHDRFGGQRLQHIGFKGTQQLFDRIVNALIEYKQENSPVGYKYI